LLKEEQEAYQAAHAAKGGESGEAASKKARTAEPELDMRIKIVDGDEVIADTAEDGGFLATCKKFEIYIRTRYALAGTKK